jgi:hypothetical protein
VPVEQTLVDHVPGAVEALLARLEHQHHASRQLLAPPREQPRGGGQHRDVRVVAARVHGAIDP